jgi:hypothetical protein
MPHRASSCDLPSEIIHSGQVFSKERWLPEIYRFTIRAPMFWRYFLISL